MIDGLTAGQRQDAESRGFSRRHFGRLAALIGSAATLPFYNERAMAQHESLRGVPADAVMIDSNENPLGPCAEARKAMYKAVDNGGRYMDEETEVYCETLAAETGVRPENVMAYPGSSLAIHHAVMSFTSPTRSLVMANPSYESPGRAARFVGANVVSVPLRKDYSHDVRAMVEQAGANAGLFYICNPNNPTGTVTKREDIDWLVANKPQGSIVMVDEAYIHLAGVPECTDMVSKDKDVVVLRTFSKIYGMAGLRAGAAIARPDLLAKMRNYNAGFLPLTAMVGATASLRVKGLVPERRKVIEDIRGDVFGFLEKNKFAYVPSMSNKFMVDVKRPGREVIMAMRREKIYIGRVWPIWPTHVRVTIGTRDEMVKFKSAFLKVMA